jgi:hypothetical protein
MTYTTAKCTEELPEICRVSCQNKFVKLVRPVGFITNKFVTMHGHMNVKTNIWTFDLFTSRFISSPKRQERCWSRTNLLFSSYLFFSDRVKRPLREADHLPLSNDKVKIERNSNSSLYPFILCRGNNCTAALVLTANLNNVTFALCHSF